ncbi:poly E-rich protein [Helicobacter pylori]|uniref:Poly E-rich protein n=1 Tax=Helicobacter pylori TaxID=210 RepID=A0A1A9HED2_HELPX|nr:hypothetical protein [Helicobacter pylori]ANH47935.1 poly E-rich protein [Helicobacter pylori]
MKMIVFNQNPMIAKLLESVSKKLELSMENFNHYEELSARLKKDLEWLLIADDESLEKLDQVDWLELKEIISQNHLNLCMYKKGNEAQPFLEGFEVKMKKPFLPTEVLKILQKKLGFNASEPKSSQNLDPTQEILETNWDELENLGDLEALAKEEPNAEEQLLPTLDAQKENEEVKEEEKEEIAETPQEIEASQVQEAEKQEAETETQEVTEQTQVQELEASQELEKPQAQEIETQEVAEEKQEQFKEETQKVAETPKEKEVSKESETLQTQEAETQEIQEEKQEQEQVKEKTQDSPSAQELEAMQELVKEIQENSNEDKKETQENAETPQTQEAETETQEITKQTETQELENQEIAESPQETEAQEITEQTETQELEASQVQETKTQELENQENAETPQNEEVLKELETPQETETQDQKTPPKTQDNYETIEDIPEPVMAKAMGEALPLVDGALIETSNNENAAQTPKESVTETPQENAKIPQKSDATSSPLELRLNLQDLLKSLNQESLKSLLENKTLSIKITLEDKKPNE